MLNKVKIDVLILIEHKARELESALLIKYFLEEKGLSVIVDSIKFHKEDVVLKYKPSIAIVPWAYCNKEMDLFRNLKHFSNRKNTFILNMHHEQISNDESDKFIIPKGEAKKTMHISWGDNYTKKLIGAGCKENSIIQCGNPKLDFYKGSLKKLSRERETLAAEYNLDVSKKWILFIANSFHLLSENQMKINISKGVDIEEQIASSIINRKEFLYHAAEYLEKNNDAIFIYRPHPSYAHLDKVTSEIENMCNKYEGFKCISENSIRDWIINSDIAMSFHSTSIIECSVSKTPFYLFRMSNLSPQKDYKFFVNYKYKIQSRADFINAICRDDRFSFNKFNEEIKEYIDLYSEEHASKIIADELIKITKTKSFYQDSIKFKPIIYLKTILICWIKKLLVLMSKNKKIKQFMINTNDIRYYNLFYEGDDFLQSSDIKNIEEKINKAFTSFKLT